MKKLSGLILLFAFLVSACNKDTITSYRATLVNNSGAKMTIVPYDQGMPRFRDSTVLQNGDSLEIASGWEFGEIKVPFFVSDFLAVNYGGWIKVTYGDTLVVLHLYDSLNSTGQKAHTFNNPRNILNRDNYEFTHSRTPSKKWFNYHIFRFTQEDYDFARQ